MPEPRQKYLYWSNVQLYSECPQNYLWSRGWPTIDLGNGLGKPKRMPVPDDRAHAIMGLSIGKAVEDLYNRELWRSPATLADEMVSIAVREMKFQIASEYVDWKRITREEMERVCADGVLGYLKTMKANRLLGPYAKSEVDIRAWVNKTTPIGGRPDIVIQRDDVGVIILDGKNTKNPDKGFDANQLRWYALCYYLMYGQLPSRLGFVLFRFPPGKPPKGYDADTWQGIVDVPVVQKDITDLAVTAMTVYEGMNTEKFQATPSGAACKYCNFESVCPERQAQLVQLRTRRGTKTRSDDIPNGIFELGFNRPK